MAKLRATGVIEYDPPRDDMKKKKDYWCVLNMSNDLVKLYQYFMKSVKHVHMCDPAWGSHVSIVRGENPTNPEAWKKYNGKQLSIHYYPEIIEIKDAKKPGSFYVIEFESPELEEIRKELGLMAHKKFHLTIGRTYHD